MFSSEIPRALMAWITEFISPAYYTSMGFAIPAAIGVQTASRKLRPLVIVGDGAFQMTGMELSNLVRRKFPTVLIVLDNRGYGTERLLHPGNWDFNNIHPWQYLDVDMKAPRKAVQ